MTLNFKLYSALRGYMLPLNDIDSAIPDEGRILDLGCGGGVILSYLSAKPKRRLIGVDKDKSRVIKNDNKFKLLHADISKTPLGKSDGVIISDVLHHMDFKTQDKVLTNVSKSLRKGGVLIVKEIDASSFIRSRLSRFWDLVLYPQDKIYYRSRSNWVKAFKKLNFTVKTKETNSLFPGSTVLYICNKK